MAEVVIIDYGAGNMQSVRFALERLGANPVPSSDHDEIRAADKIIFPGVGEAKSAMDVINKLELDKLIPSLEQDVLGICMGMQLMCNFSEERETKCLGIYDQSVNKFRINEKVPHMGWNTIEFPEHEILEGIPSGASFYFVHSYYVPLGNETLGTCFYGHEFSAIMQKSNFYGCQFHPEKSAKNGTVLLENFLKL